MPIDDDDFLLKLLQACADRAPEPLYPARYAEEHGLDRETLDLALDELRRRGLIQLTDWIKDVGQGRALTESGKKALAAKNPAMARADAPSAAPDISIYDRGEIVRDAIYRPQRPIACWVLITVNILFFLFGAFYAWQHDLPVGEYLAGEDGAHQTTTFVLFELGALYHRVVLPDPALDDFRPEFERILLALFLHIGLFHLAMNMYFLGALGAWVESMWGTARFLAIYFVAGIVSSCVVLSFDLLHHRNGLTAGASGSMYGLFASMLVWLVVNRQHLPDLLLQDWSRPLAINMILLVGVNFVAGVSWQGHLGGAIGGLLAALLLHVQRFHPSRVVRTLALLALPMVPIAFFAAVLKQAGWW